MSLAALHRAPTDTGQTISSGSVEVQLGTEWMGLRMGDARVGLMKLTKSTRPEGGFRYAMRTELQFKAMEQAQHIKMQVDADLDSQLTLTAFDFEVAAGPARFEGRGRVIAGPAIEMTTTSGGQSSTRTIALKGPPVLRANLGPVLRQQALEPGARFTFHTFDPLTQRDQAVEIEVIGREPLVIMGASVDAIHIRQRVGALTLSGWINARGEMLQQELGMGLVAIRETEAEARWGLTEVRAGRAAPDLVRATMIAVDGLPERLTDRSTLVLDTAGYDLSGFAIAGRRQRLDGRRLTIRRERVGPGLPLATAPGADETLAAEPLIQVDHPRVRAAAREAIGDATDTVTASRRIMSWIARHLDQRLVPGVPSALEVLDTRVGDCNEHTTLFAALARASGIPTRVVVGLAYQHGQFGYHAWNEVRTEAGWLTVDATWQQMPADVGHLRLVLGGLGEQVALLPLFGRLTLKVVP